MVILLLKRIWRQSEENQGTMLGHYLLAFMSKKEIIQWANSREMWARLHTWCYYAVTRRKNYLYGHVSQIWGLTSVEYLGNTPSWQSSNSPVQLFPPLSLFAIVWHMFFLFPEQKLSSMLVPLCLQFLLPRLILCSQVFSWLRLSCHLVSVLSVSPWRGLP